MKQKITEKNERILRKYAVWKREARRADVKTVDKVLMSVREFIAFTRGKDFASFNVEQAVEFKRYLDARRSKRTGALLSKKTIDGTLRGVKDFFVWLADQPGYRSRIKRLDTEYFNLNAKDSRIAHEAADAPFPTPEQALHAFLTMPETTQFQRRDKAMFALLMLTGARDGALASLKLKHVDLKDRCIIQDAREVKTKASKTIQSWFFPVHPAYGDFFNAWVTYLRHERLFGPNDAVFPKTRIAPVNGRFTTVGLDRAPYADASRIRETVKAAFATVGLPTFSPHSFRRTLVSIANVHCKTPEEFKAWSLNLGHDDISTTLYAYCPVSTGRQRELIKRMTDEDNVIE